MFVLLAFLAGVFSASFVDIPRFISFELLFLGLLYGLVFRKNKKIFLFSFCLLALFLGLWRAQDVVPKTQTGETGHFLFLRNRLEKAVEQNLSFPESAVLSATLFGNQKQIPKEWQTKLNIAGLRHIVAISGMHIVVIIGVLAWLGLGLGLGRLQANWFALIFIWLFILMIGYAASAIRAGIMGTIFILADVFGRQKASSRVLLFTAALMLLQNPSLLRYNIGFQLSFLATLGLIELAPFFQGLLERLKVLKKLKLAGLLSMTLAAQVFTLPVLLFQFGQLSLVSLITNVLVVPTTTYLMIFGFLFAIFGALFQPLSFIFLLPTWLLSRYFILVTDTASRLPLAFFQLKIHWIFVFLAYALLALFVWQLKKRRLTKIAP